MIITPYKVTNHHMHIQTRQLQRDNTLTHHLRFTKIRINKPTGLKVDPNPYPNRAKTHRISDFGCPLPSLITAYLGKPDYPWWTPSSLSPVSSCTWLVCQQRWRSWWSTLCPQGAPSWEFPAAYLADLLACAVVFSILAHTLVQRHGGYCYCFSTGASVIAQVTW